jgi:5-amino-6-(5-phospho-D-ribitylamino)uracil phosphatase
MKKSKHRHLIAIDLDGTLLDDRKKILHKTKHYLKKLDRQGHIVVLASGRPVRALKKYHDQLALRGPMVCYNGSWYGNPDDGGFKTVAFAFPKEIIKDIYHQVGENYIDNIMCETNKDIWLIKPDIDLSAFFWHTHMNIIYGDIRQTLNEDPMTCMIKSTIRGEHHDQVLYDAIKNHPNLRIRFWNRSMISELYFEGVSKGHALLEIAQYYQIPQENILAFGDADNDLEMLSMAGVGFAMKNATELTKQHADVVTDYDNNNNGIYYALKQYFK